MWVDEQEGPDGLEVSESICSPTCLALGGMGISGNKGTRMKCTPLKKASNAIHPIFRKKSENQP